MTTEETLANVQVAHLFLKAADQGVLLAGQAQSALHRLFPGLIRPIPSAFLDLPDGISEEEAIRFRDEWVKSHTGQGQ